jgi:pyrimidine-specific ribonucleoside hydrolase
MPHAPVVVCDPGIDDLLALLVLVGAGDPPSAVVGTAGNIDAGLAYRNATGIVELLGLDCPVAQGSQTGLSGPYRDIGEPFHGSDGLGGIGSALPVTPQTRQMLDPLSLISGSVLATGPLTVVAQALAIGQPISDLVWMGGAISDGGNMTALAEFNAWLDPEAADQVLSSAVPIAMVPLDVTHQVPLDRSDLEDMGTLGELAALAARSCIYLHDQHGHVYPHDAVAAVAQMNPELFGWDERWVRCELSGTWTRGMTVVDRREHGEIGFVRVAHSVQAAAVKERIFEALRTLG